ncbi:hypothetical protein [Caulobacter sp. 17J65-9]|uniref:alpha/beta hydrolase family protein n=1 Tax=Caulobacter sp. 17J65-9 TaxID=2709382 RepID=UPI0013C9C6A1|nr:hypothetical protein [Caulobacter sp. 17J65-9]NEX94425.1 hypothetical protein [Caulobacter sp. 17J65-9]
MSLSLAIAVFLLIGGTSAHADPVFRTIDVKRADGSSIDVRVHDRGHGAADQALLLVSGSDCKSIEALGWSTLAAETDGPRWVVAVDKEGASRDGTCGPTYESQSTEQARWFDHVAAMNRLKRELGLRDRGAFRVFAVSAGGLTACALAGATDDVEAVALLSTGGGMTFDQELSLLTKDDPDFAKQKHRVASDPRVGATWLGATNPEIWWRSVLPTRCLDLMEGYRGRVLVAHARGDESTPVESARRLVEGLKAQGLTPEYVEIDGGHALNREVLARAFEWLSR